MFSNSWLDYCFLKQGNNLAQTRICFLISQPLSFEIILKNNYTKYLQINLCSVGCMFSIASSFLTFSPQIFLTSLWPLFSLLHLISVLFNMKTDYYFLDCERSEIQTECRYLPDCMQEKNTTSQLGQMSFPEEQDAAKSIIRSTSLRCSKKSGMEISIRFGL